MNKNTFFLSLLFLCCLSYVNPAESSMITQYFEGTMWTIIDNGNYLGGAITTGDTFSGTLTYDLAAIDSNPDPNVGEYVYDKAPNGITVTINGLTFYSDPANTLCMFSILNDDTANLGDIIEFDSNTNNFPVGPAGASKSIFIYLNDHSYNVLSADTLPSSINISDWAQNHFVIMSGTGDYTEYNFLIDGSISNITPIPIPSAIWLLGLGLVGLVGLKRMKK